MRHRVADVYKAGVLAARLERHGGGTRFSYLPAYLASGGPAVASSLPLSAEPVLSAAGGRAAVFHRAAAGGQEAERAAPVREDQCG